MDARVPIPQTMLPTPNGVRIMAALGPTQILAWGTTYYLLTVLAAPISADTGWPLTLVVGSLSAALLVAGFASPKVGRLILRHGGRYVLAGGAVLLGAGLAVIGLAPSLPVFLAGWLVIGLAMSASLYDPAFSTLGRIYGEAARRPITTLTLFGGLARSVCWPLSAWLVDSVGWRGACLVYAAVQIGFCLPCFWPGCPGSSRTPSRKRSPGRGPPGASSCRPGNGAWSR